MLYPPLAGLHAARSRDFDGLHGFLADSLPDSWGALLLRRRLAKRGIDFATLSPLDRLALVGAEGRGALVFEPATTPSDDVETLDLDRLEEESHRILIEGDARLADTLTRLGAGSGGARPKVQLGIAPDDTFSVGSGALPPGYTAWIVKFGAPGDPPDIGPIEEAYAAMAEAAGIEMSAHRLLPSARGHGHFATRRFDRNGTGRLHMLSLAGAIEGRSDIPSAGYDMFLRATRAITRRADDVTSVFRRMVFNVLAHNRDDHTRQHAFLMDAAGDWRLSPAYDLTHSDGPGGEHMMDIDGEGRRPTANQVGALAARHGIRPREGAAIIDRVRAAVADWRHFASAAHVTPSSTNAIANSHARVWRDFSGA